VVHPQQLADEGVLDLGDVLQRQLRVVELPVLEPAIHDPVDHGADAVLVLLVK
jgi:hypothetical protein